jgi:flagellar motor component MotA
MVFKGFAVLALVAFLALTAQATSVPLGAPFMILTLIALSLGFLSVLLFLMPRDFLSEVWTPLRNPLPDSADSMARQLESIAAVIRQDGLLALESRRKDLRNPELRVLLKRIMDGFEGKDLLPLIANQARKREELADEASAVLRRFHGFLPQAGLIQSLILMVSVLSGPRPGPQGIGIAHALLPFGISLLLQIPIESWIEGFLEQKKKDARLYFAVLEEGIAGIQIGQNPELLGDRIRSRLSAAPVWKET